MDTERSEVSTRPRRYTYIYFSAKLILENRPEDISEIILKVNDRNRRDEDGRRASPPVSKPRPCLLANSADEGFRGTMACQQTASEQNLGDEVMIMTRKTTCRWYLTNVFPIVNQVYSPGFRPNLSFPEAGEVCKSLKLYLECMLMLNAVQFRASEIKKYS